MSEKTSTSVVIENLCRERVASIHRTRESNLAVHLLPEGCRTRHFYSRTSREWPCYLLQYQLQFITEWTPEEFGTHFMTAPRCRNCALGWTASWDRRAPRTMSTRDLGKLRRQTDSVHRIFLFPTPLQNVIRHCVCNHEWNWKWWWCLSCSTCFISWSLWTTDSITVRFHFRKSFIYFTEGFWKSIVIIFSITTKLITRTWFTMTYEKWQIFEIDTKMLKVIIPHSSTRIHKNLIRKRNGWECKRLQQNRT